MTEKFNLKKMLADLSEDAPVNNAGSGNVDGIGVGPKGEPGVYRKMLSLYKRIMTPNVRRSNSKSKR